VRDLGGGQPGALIAVEPVVDEDAHQATNCPIIVETGDRGRSRCPDPLKLPAFEDGTIAFKQRQQIVRSSLFDVEVHRWRIAGSLGLAQVGDPACHRAIGPASSPDGRSLKPSLRIQTKSPGCTDMKSPGDSETMSPTFPI